MTGLTNAFPEKEERLRFVAQFFAARRVLPISETIAHILIESVFAAVNCGIMWVPLPEATTNMLADCDRFRQEVRTKYRGFGRIDDEVLCFVHGLRRLDPRILAYVKDRAAVDIGGFIGDSAVVLMDFAKSVHSFEPSPSNFERLSRAMEDNRRPGITMEAIPMGLSDSIGTVAFHDSANPGAKITSNGEIIVKLTTLDTFWKDRPERLGFVKCDTEGYGLPVLRGARQTLIRHRPVVSFAVYHNFDEFFGIPPLLEEWLVNYSFQWAFGVNGDYRWHELVFLGYPNEALGTAA
jgi:FkbM family methyltransferase